MGQARSRFLSAKDFNQQLMVLMTVKSVDRGTSLLDTVKSVIEELCHSRPVVAIAFNGGAVCPVLFEHAGRRLICGCGLRKA